jgi:UDP-N-acetylenolpyruvoylglucosamine reductase
MAAVLFSESDDDLHQATEMNTEQHYCTLRKEKMVVFYRNSGVNKKTVILHTPFAIRFQTSLLSRAAVSKAVAESLVSAP